MLTKHNTYRLLTDLSNALDPEEVDGYAMVWASHAYALDRIDPESPEAEEACEIHDELIEIYGLVADLKEAVDNLRQVTG